MNHYNTAENSGRQSDSDNNKKFASCAWGGYRLSNFGRERYTETYALYIMNMRTKYFFGEHWGHQNKNIGHKGLKKDFQLWPRMKFQLFRASKSSKCGNLPFGTGLMPKRNSLGRPAEFKARATWRRNMQNDSKDYLQLFIQLPSIEVVSVSMTISINFGIEVNLFHEKGACMLAIFLKLHRILWWIITSTGGLFLR